jgi:tetratricopeptide (TPR) repeat protein
VILLSGFAGAAGGMIERALEPTPQARADRSTAAAPDLSDLFRRISAIEATLADRAREPEVPRAEPGPLPKSEAPLAREPKGMSPPVAAPGAPPDQPPEAHDPLDGILDRTFGYAESRSLFRTLSRDHSAIANVIARLEAEIAKNPRSADLQAALATAYAAKTAFDTPPGPEQGTVWAKAEQAYDEAIRLDPEHWQARYGKAFGDSMAPEFVGLRPRAIREFEELMEIQEKKPLAPEHAEVYVRLGTLYKDAGNPKKARETWKRGLERFPDDQRLSEALALVEEK